MVQKLAISKVRRTVASSASADKKIALRQTIARGEARAEAAEDRDFVSALSRGLEILEVFQAEPGRLSHKDLCNLTGLAKATVSRLVHTLQTLGYLVRCEDNTFELSPRVLSLGYPFLVSRRYRHFAHDDMMALARMGDYTVAIGAPDFPDMVYIEECTVNRRTGLQLDIGARLPMATSGVGRAWLAALSDDQLVQTKLGLSAVYGNEWPSIEARISNSVDEVRSRGFCIVDSEWRNDTRSVAVPLVGDGGGPILAMSCAAPVYACTRQSLEEEIGPRLVRLAHSLALIIGK